MISCGMPYFIAACFVKITPLLLWLLPRVFLFAVSLLNDRWVYRIAKKVEKQGDCAADAAMFIYQSSWITLVFSSRPFSNTLEAVLVNASFYVVLQWRKPFLALGCLCGCGMFTRITFPVFILPVAIEALYDHLGRCNEAFRKRNGE